MSNTEELKTLEQLNIKATQGDLVREFTKHPGFKLYQDKINELIDKQKQGLLRSSFEKAREQFFRAQGLQDALDILNKFQKIGAFAKSEIKRHAEEF